MAPWRQIFSSAVKTLLYAAIFLAAVWFAANHYRTTQSDRPLVIEDTEPGFDLDDIEVVDGLLDKSYGSFPDIRFLDAQGNVTANLTTSADGGRASFRLIYMVPESIPSIKLRYWGKDMHRPVRLSDQAAHANTDGVTHQ